MMNTDKRLLAIGRATSPCPLCGSYLSGFKEDGAVYCVLCLRTREPGDAGDLDPEESRQDIVEGEQDG